MRGLNDSQQSTLIGVIARVPVEQARKLVLVELEKQLAGKKRVTNEQLLAAINSVLAAIPPGTYSGDAQGAFPPITEDLTLKEAATLYERVIHPRGEWCWPPIPLPTPEEAKAKADRLAAMTQKQLAEAYGRSLFNSDAEYEAAKADEEKRRQAEETADATPWPLPSPKSTRTIRGEVVDDELDHPIVPLAERVRPRQPSIYGRALMQLRGELPKDMSDAERARAFNEQLERERRQRRRDQGPPKSFFR